MSVFEWLVLAHLYVIMVDITIKNVKRQYGSWCPVPVRHVIFIGLFWPIAWLWALGTGLVKGGD